MYNCGLIKFKNMKDIRESYGALVPIEGKKDIPFEIKRIYYIKDVENGVTRGFHSHRVLHQVLICISGTVKIRVKNSKEEEIIELNNSSYGLYIGPMIWREMFDFSKGAVLLVLASEYYDAKDYLKDYSDYLEEAKKLF
ncbi:FdtA/QdtA family cupin domain-containing protein [Clostridium carnis]